MKKNIWRQLQIIALAGALSLTLLGCGEKKEDGGEPPVQETEEPEEKDLPEGEASQDIESPAEGAETEKKAENADTQSDESPIGEIEELGDGQFTIKKFFQEITEDGAQILGSPAAGSEETGGFDSLVIVYDEDTRFYKRTIRDGGASWEDEESSADKLEKGMQVNLKGSYEGEAFHASEVQITEVVLKEGDGK